MAKTLKFTLWLGLAAVIFTPLIVNGHFFFPFIVPKTLVFYLAVEIMFLAFLALALKDGGQYRLRLNLPIALFGLYLILITLASLLGNDFYHGFWSNNERSEGIFLLLHLWLLLIVLTGFWRKLKDWLYVFDLSFLSSFLVSLVAFVQYLHNKELLQTSFWIFQSSGGQRLASTIGNAGYVAGFLIFAIFFGCWLLSKRQNPWLRAYYVLGIILNVFVVFQTYTRGGILALFFAGLGLVVYLTFFYFRNRRLRWAGAGCLVAAVVLTIFIFANKQADFIQNNQILGRIASISVNSNTAQTRLMTWSSAWQGFKERPIFGWGQENFYQVFNKYFNPKIYSDAGAVVWFDRAHNMIFDRLVTGGILGLLAYLAFIFAPLFFLWRHFWRQSRKGTVRDYKKFFIPTIFTLLVLAYFLQNLFIFEALVTYVPLFLSLAFIGLFGPEWSVKFLGRKNFKTVFLIIAAVVIICSFYFGVVRPARANLLITRAISAPNLTITDRLDIFEKALGSSGSGNQEYSQQLLTFFDSLSGSNYNDQQGISRLVNLTRSALDRQIQENPFSVSNFLAKMRFNNSVYFLYKQPNPTYLNENLNLFAKAVELSPTRQAVYFEVGYSYIYLADYFKANGQAAVAQEDFALAIKQFEHAVELNDQNLDSWGQLIGALVYSNDNQAVWDALSRLADQKLPNYQENSFFTQVLSRAETLKNYGLIIFLSNKMLEKNGPNLDYYHWLISAQVKAGQKSEALKSAKKLQSTPGYATSGQELIDQINSGDFETATTS